MAYCGIKTVMASAGPDLKVYVDVIVLKSAHIFISHDLLLVLEGELVLVYTLFHGRNCLLHHLRPLLL
jgi:hypothetical protein